MTVVVLPPTAVVDNQHASTPAQQKKKFGTVFGFRSASRNRYSQDERTSAREQARESLALGRNTLFARASVDTPTTATYSTARRKKPGHTAGRFSVTNVSFFERGAPSASAARTQTTTTTTADDPNNISTPPVPTTPKPAIIDLTLDNNNNMKALDTNIPSGSRRGPVRMDTQDGPWSVSVAETPYDARSYSLYIKTPTHNLTLTRTATELVELDLKLRHSHSSIKIPTLPINPDTLPPPPPKRKSTFLNTLSRLASPTGAKASLKGQRESSSSRRAGNASSATGAPVLPSPLGTTTPGFEIGDPFGSFTSATSGTSNSATTTGDGESSALAESKDSSVINGSSAASSTVLSTAPPSSSPTTPTASTTSTALASYLTTLSNIPSLRTDRVWKRFVHVRTDDLESVRVERAIKRVRSDLAAHTGGGGGGGLPSVKEREKENGSATNLTTPMEKENVADVKTSENGRVPEKEVDEEKDGRVAHGEMKEEDALEKGDGHPSKSNNATESTMIQEDASTASATDPSPADAEAETETIDEGSVSPIPHAADSDLPASTTTNARIPRSQSAEPDKSHRVSRAYTSSVPSQSGAESQTGDEESSSSAAATGGTGSGKRTRRRKKARRSLSRAGKELNGSSTTGGSKEPRKSQRKVVIDDFEMMRVLGKGCAGKVLLVRHKQTQDLFALKAITKRHVLAHQELQHTLTEQAVLKRMAAESRDPFVVKLWWSFHDRENLFLVMDFHPGGDLATQLARWGRLGRDRARFYAAEIVEGVEGLHAAGVIYRDLKPENILIGGDGHIVLTDFGLSKEFPRRLSSSSNGAGSVPLTPGANGSPPGTARGGEFYSSVPGTPQPVTPPWMKLDRSGEMALGWPGQPIGHTDSTTTFCGTAEYLAPEVIQGLPYSYEVDWWSFGTMLYEMLTGITPFWANNHSDMYVRVLQDELQFPDDRAIDQDTKSLIRGLLQRVPTLRICEPRIKKHPYFSMIDWSHVYYKRYIPPYIPPIDPSNASDTQNFDDTFLDMEPVLDEFNDEATDTDQEPQTDAERTDGEETNTTPSQSRSSSIRPQPQLPAEDDVDVFDGYSFKGRHSVLIDDEEDQEDEGSGSEESTDEDEDNLSILKGLEQHAAQVEGTHVQPVETEQDQEESGVEPKTPEARPAALPPVEDATTPAPAEPKVEPVHVEEEISEAPRTEEGKVDEPLVSRRKSKDLVSAEAAAAAAVAHEKATPSKVVTATRIANNRAKHPRKERSGVAALDRYLSDPIDEDTEATEAERDEDDDWDFIEAADGEDRNGAKGTSLFARGVVDRYRLAVFRKASTPSKSGQRVASGMSSTTEGAESPSPSQRRGRTPLTFRKHPRQFLRPKSPPSSFSSKSAARSISQFASHPNTNSAASTSSAVTAGGMLTPSHSMGSTFANSPSLKSKESAMSVGALSHSSDQSNGQSAVFVEAADAIRSSPQDKYTGKNKKLKKYKNNAEKVFSLFSSPRPTPPT